MSEAGPSTSSSRPPVPGFQPASALPRPQVSTNVSSASSLRNASGGQPPIPKPVEIPVGDEKEQEKENATAGPSKPVQRPVTRKNAIVYNAVQRRNPVLQGIKNVGLEIGDIVADYQVGTHNGVLFLSLKYHRLHPEYIHQRIEKMKNMYKLRILLVLCDINEHQQTLREITKIAIINEFSTFVAWSNDEVASYLTSFKAQETASANPLKEKVHQSYHNQLQHALTSGKKVNKTDADNLASQFGSFRNIASQSSKTLSGVKGLGAAKVTSLVDAFSKPFLIGGLRRDDGTVRPAIDIVADKRQNGTSLNISNSDKGKGKKIALDPEKNFGQSGSMTAQDPEIGETVEAIGSPDWPSEEEDLQQDTAAEIPRGREKVPSRSPGVSPELRSLDQDANSTSGETWKDPLDDDVEEDEDDDDDQVDRPVSKKARLMLDPGGHS